VSAPPRRPDLRARHLVLCGDNIRPAEAGTCSRVWGVTHDFTQCAWGVTHASTQHVHAVPGESRMTRSSTYTRNHRRVVGGYRSAVPLPAQPSHQCVNTAGVGVSLSHGALRSLPALWLPLLVGFACGVQFYPGAHPCFNWHHVRRELDRTRRLGSTGIVRAGGTNHSRRTHQG
jgi:hypothetical protein